jgi:hypothetical protein
MVWGTMPIGSLIGGALGNTIGLRPTLWVAAVGGLFSFVPPLLSPVRSLEQIPEPSDGEPSGDLATSLAVGDEGVLPEGHVPRAAEGP